MSNAGKNVVEGTFGATGQSAELPVFGKGTLVIEGGAGTVQVERSYDAGSTWQIASKNADGDQAIYTAASGTGFNGVLEETEGQILYRLNCTAYTSTITYRMTSNPAG